MQKLLYLLLFTACSFAAQAQFRVLFVDDTDDIFGNAELLASAFDSLGYETVYFDAIGQDISPTVEDMNDYDVVVWYTSSWGLDLQLWADTDTDNVALRTYLAQPTANFWLIGLDYFYDRYGTAPVTFQSGDFAYDHLGISKYAAQSYADDGNVGVPVVTPAPNQPIPGLENITWQFSTLWYADGFELRPEAKAVYLFGDENYSLSGQPTGVFYHPEGGARVLTYGFDLGLAANFDSIRNHVGTVMDWWQGKVNAVKSPPTDWEYVQISPNAFSDYLDIRMKTIRDTPISVQMYNATGQLVAQVANQEMAASNIEKTLHWSVPAGLPNGLYYCTVQSDGQVYTAKVVKERN